MSAITRIRATLSWLRPRSARLVALLIAVLGLAGGVVAVAGGGADRDPAPAVATADVPGVVSLGRPIDPIAIARGDGAEIELRARGGVAVLVFDEVVARRGRRVDRRCTLSGPESAVRATPDLSGSCVDRRRAEPLSTRGATRCRRRSRAWSPPT